MSRRRPSPLRLLAWVLALALVAAAATLGWATLGTDITGRRRATRLAEQARAAMVEPPAASMAEGKPFAILSADRLGISWPVVAGVGADDLEGALGWYPQTAAPGEKGNMAIAGLRVTHGSPFRKLLEFQPGDVITVDAAAGTFRYRVLHAPAVVDQGPSGAWVLDPVPGTNQSPTTSLLTLTTAADLVATGRRAVVFAELVP